jgi:hypothetical protein
LQQYCVFFVWLLAADFALFFWSEGAGFFVFLLLHCQSKVCLVLSLDVHELQGDFFFNYTVVTSAPKKTLSCKFAARGR